MQMHLVNSSLILYPFPEMNSYLCLSSLYTLSWVISFNNDLIMHLGVISLPDADNIQIYIFNPNSFLSFNLICFTVYLTSLHGCASFPSKLICPNLFIFLYFLSWWNYLITQFSKPENCMVFPSTCPYQNNYWLYWKMLNGYCTSTFPSSISRKLIILFRSPHTQHTCFRESESHYIVEACLWCLFFYHLLKKISLNDSSNLINI